MATVDYPGRICSLIDIGRPWDTLRSEEKVTIGNFVLNIDFW